MLQVRLNAAKEGVKVYAIALVVVLKLAKQAIAATMDCAANKAVAVIVVKDGLVLRKWLAAQGAKTLVASKQVKPN